MAVTPIAQPTIHKGDWTVVTQFANTNVSHGKCLFLEMPGEIRNAVYENVYDGAFVAMMPFSGHDKTRYASNNHANGYRHAVSHCYSGISFRSHVSIPSYHHMYIISENPQLRGKKLPFLCRQNRRNENATRLPRQTSIDTALLLTCKQINKEFAPFVYSRTIFAFGAQHCVRDLLRDHVISPELRRSKTMPSFRSRIPVSPISTSNRDVIKHLCLECLPYGEPGLREHRDWYGRYYERWARICRFVISKLVALEDLTLYITAPVSRPFKLSLDNVWVAPFLQFAQIATLQTAAVYISSPDVREISQETLWTFCEMMRPKILGWDDTTVLEAIASSKRMHRKDRLGFILDEQWKLLEEWNGVE